MNAYQRCLRLLDLTGLRFIERRISEDVNHYIGSFHKFRELKLAHVDNTMLIEEVRIKDRSIEDGGIDENSEGEYCFNVDLCVHGVSELLPASTESLTLAIKIRERNGNGDIERDSHAENPSIPKVEGDFA